MQKVASRSFVAALFLALCSSTAIGQPNAWTTRTVQGGLATLHFLDVYDLGLNRSLLHLQLPDGTFAGQGAFSPDQRYFYLPTALGIGRFDVATRSFESVFSQTVQATSIFVSPSGQWVHVAYGSLASSNYRILSAATGATVHDECCFPSGLAFSKTTARRFVARDARSGSSQSSVAAFGEAPSSAAIWTVVLPEQPGIGRLEADDQFVTFLATYAAPAEPRTDVVVLNAETGAEVSRRTLADIAAGISSPPSSVAAIGTARHGNLLLITMGSDSDPKQHLLVIGLPGLTRDADIQRDPGIPSRSQNLGVRISSDGSTAYWLMWTSVFGVTVSNTTYDVVDLATRRLLPGGGLGSQFVFNVAIQAGTPCTFDFPPVISVPAAGGTVDIPATPSSACPAWTADGGGAGSLVAVLNPGPHSGPATIRAFVTPNINRFGAGSSRALAVRIGGHIARLHQEAETTAPGAPTLSGSAAGGRIRLDWIPASGPLADVIEIRGGVRGGTVSPVATVPGDTRTWTSAVVPAGSYTLEIVARGDGGDSARSNRVDLSIGVAGLADAPTLAAYVSDDAVRLTWVPASGGPAPASYLVEAAAQGAAVFAAVAMVNGQEFAASGVPAGNWQVRIRPVTAGGPGASSNVVSLSTSVCSAAPAAPTALTAILDGASVTLLWIPPSPAGVASYVLEGGSASGSSNVGRFMLAGGSPSVNVNAPSGLYYVRLRARNGCGESAPSNEVIAFVP